MPINFTQLFNDSWNFLRNQRQFSIAFIALFALNSAIQILMRQPYANLAQNPEAANPQQVELLLQQTNSANPWLYLAQILLNLFVGYWVMISIHQISQRNFQSLVQSALAVLPRLFGSCLLTLASSIVGIIGIFYLLAALMTHLLLNQPLSLTTPLVFTALGAWLFARLCLAPLNYLLTNNSVAHALKQTFKAGKGRNGILFTYLLINYFVPTLLIVQFSYFATNVVMTILALLLIAFTNLFLSIFTYRFYQVFNQQA